MRKKKMKKKRIREKRILIGFILCLVFLTSCTAAEQKQNNQKEGKETAEKEQQSAKGNQEAAKGQQSAGESQEAGTKQQSAGESQETEEIKTGLPEGSLEENEIAVKRSLQCNPIVGQDENGAWQYGGDPAVLVDNDTVYLYTGRDSSSDAEVEKAIYMIREWVCYSTKDFMDWEYQGVVMSADTESIPWATGSTSAWASQVAKHYDNEAGIDKYYLYYCTWDKTSSGKMSIGVAVSESPTGPFLDKGEPLVKGTLTEPQTSNWNDIDPTVWVETDSQGEEHRYLAWGNGRFYLCELNEDMMSVKDLDGDGEITCGYSADSADVLAQGDGIVSFTEAPWLYRRKDNNGNYYGPYYLFYANGWREKMAYATTEDLLGGKWKFGRVLMMPTATSNTNHMAVFDFKDKTYFVYHNGSLPAGNGYRRAACITELHFRDDGSIEELPETAAGLGRAVWSIRQDSEKFLTHKAFLNSNADKDYPYTDIEIGCNLSDAKEDREWVITDGKADPTKAAYISIQSENKPGLYITINEDKTVTLSQDIDASEDTAKRQTFRTIKGLGNENGISLESAALPGMYLAMKDDILCLADDSEKEAITFYIE